jgi:hypothetical protein
MGKACGIGNTVDTTGGKSTSSVNPAFQPGLTSVGQQLTDYINKPYDPYKGQMVAGTNPLIDQAARSMAALQPNANVNRAADIVGMGATRDFTGADVQKYMNPYTSTLKNAAIANYADTLPKLGSMATGVGGHGGSREALLQAKAQQGLQGTLSGIDVDAFNNAQKQFNTETENMLKGGYYLKDVGNTQFTQAANAANNQYNMGAGLRGISQDDLNAAYQAYLNTMNYTPNKLQTASNIVSQYPTNQTVQSSAAGPNYVMQGLSALHLMNQQDNQGNSFWSDLKSLWS